MTVEELVERYLSTRIGVKPNTKSNYNFVKNLMKKEDFYYKKIEDRRCKNFGRKAVFDKAAAGWKKV